jgi:hypothetical protein
MDPGLKGCQYLLGAVPGWIQLTDREKMEVGRICKAAWPTQLLMDEHAQQHLPWQHMQLQRDAVPPPPAAAVAAAAAAAASLAATCYDWLWCLVVESPAHRAFCCHQQVSCTATWLSI